MLTSRPTPTEHPRSAEAGHAPDPISLACAALLPAPGEIEKSILTAKIVRWMDRPPGDENYSLESLESILTGPELPDQRLVAELLRMREAALSKGYFQVTDVQNVVADSQQALPISQILDGSYFDVAANHIGSLLTPFRGCTTRIESTWRFPDGLQGGPYLIFSKGETDFGLVRISYGVFSRDNHKEDPKLKRFTHKAERAVIKAVFNSAEPDEQSRAGIRDHPLMVIGTIQGIAGVDPRKLDLPDASSRRLMLDAVVSSCQVLQRAQWAIGLSPGGHSLSLPIELADERHAFNYKLRNPLFVEDFYQIQEAIIPRSALGRHSLMAFYPLTEPSHNGALRRLYKEREATAAQGKY